MSSVILLIATYISSSTVFVPRILADKGIKFHRASSLINPASRDNYVANLTTDNRDNPLFLLNSLVGSSFLNSSHHTVSQQIIANVDIEINLLARIYHIRNHSKDAQTEHVSSNLTVPFQFPVLDQYAVGTEINSSQIMYALCLSLCFTFSASGFNFNISIL
jgi:hypothetical protein